MGSTPTSAIKLNIIQAFFLSYPKPPLWPKCDLSHDHANSASARQDLAHSCFQVVMAAERSFWPMHQNKTLVSLEQETQRNYQYELPSPLKTEQIQMSGILRE